MRVSLGGILVLASGLVVGCGGVTLKPDPCDAGTHLVGRNCVANPNDGTAAGTAGTVGAAGTTAAAGSSGAAGTTGAAGSGRDAGAGMGGGTDASSDAVDSGAKVDAGSDAAETGGADAGMAQFIVRVTVTTLGADGFSSIPVIVLGTDPSGQPSTARVVLGVSRAGAGTLAPATVTLGAAGATSYYTPCNAAQSSVMCLGKVRITLALASAPSDILAQSQEITLVVPEGVGSPGPCLVGGNVLFFNGEAGNFIFSGMQTVTKGTWKTTATATQVHVNVTPSDTKQGLWWDLYFDSSKLGMPLMPQVYADAMRWPFQTDGHPGLDVSGDGRGCNMVSGRFQIEDLTMTNGAVTSFTATFEHHCDGSAALRGCVHVEQ